MADPQGKTFNTVGDLREAIQSLPAETKLGFVSQDQNQSIGDGGTGNVEADQGLDGISMIHDGDRVSFSSVKSSGLGGSTSGPS